LIRLTCTVCKTEMQIDDAFAGGACRCQHCGTIQTVPKRLKPSPTTGKPNPAKTQSGVASQAKPLYEKKVRPDIGLSSGLDELAEVVAGSGLSSVRSRGLPPAKKANPPAAVAPPQKSKSTLLLLIAGIIILILIGVIIWMTLRLGH
jgi:hypothetical protein